MRDDFIQALEANRALYGVMLQEPAIESLADYYELVQEHNPILHLVGPSTPEEFATRHILESLTLLDHLPKDARFVDVGPGAGLPSVPCLIARDDLSGVLVESKEKKAAFLKKAAEKCAIESRTEVIARQFSEIKRPDVPYVTCRALDKFIPNLARLVKWSGRATMLFFGGPSLKAELEKNRVRFEMDVMPRSNQRYLFKFRT